MSDLIKDLSLYEIDSLEIVYQLLINDSKVLNETGHGKDNDHIFKYHIPEENREVPPLIRIHPISELPEEYADNEQLRSEEHTSELQSRGHLVCRLLPEKKKKKNNLASHEI